jgi:hypothetical protein
LQYGPGDSQDRLFVPHFDPVSTKRIEKIAVLPQSSQAPQ